MNSSAAETARLRRYSRHLLVPEIGLSGQEKLSSARVLCIGAGGLGNPIAAYLAAAGVGCIGIIDDDIVDITNLQRQILFSQADIGRPKVDVISDRIQAANPHVQVEAFHARLTPANAMDLFNAYDVIIDGSDNFSTRYLVNDAAVLTKRANIFASIYRFEAQITTFAPAGGPCYRCLFPIPPTGADMPSCAEGGVLGAVAGLAGSWQATEVLKWIMAVGTPLTGRLLRIDTLGARQRELTILRDPECPLCGDASTIHSLSTQTYEHEEIFDSGELDIEPAEVDALLESGARILDVREPHEAILGLLDGGLHIPYSQLPQRLHELDPHTTYIVACRIGARSMLALQRLKDAGLKRLYHLRGGILGYAVLHHELDAF